MKRALSTSCASAERMTFSEGTGSMRMSRRFTFRRRAVDRWEGVLFLVIYAAYIAYLVR